MRDSHTCTCDSHLSLEDLSIDVYVGHIREFLIYIYIYMYIYIYIYIYIERERERERERHIYIYM